MPRYFAAPGSPFTDDDAQEIGPELAALAESGASSPRDIVEYARKNDTPLRRHLHMDRPVDEVAEAWYRRRARKVASSILVTVRTGSGYANVRAFHSVRVSMTEDEEQERPRFERKYVTIRQARASEELAEQVLADALSRLVDWRDRYATYREVFTHAVPGLEDVFEAVEAVEAA